jgi:predicted MFS family arabinose efflux permease
MTAGGAALVLAPLGGLAMPWSAARPACAIAALRSHFANPALRAAFGIGFLILFVFVGTFTYVNFVLAGAPIGLSSMTLGLAYLVFLPSLVTTPAAGSVAAWIGPSRAILVGLALASTGLPLLLVPSVWCVLAGMTFIGVGTFFAQAVATGFVGRAAVTERAAASGLYLASYYLGGLAGAVILGQCFAVFGWAATVAGLGVGLAIAAVLAPRLALSGAGERRVPGVSTPHCHPNPERVR